MIASKTKAVAAFLAAATLLSGCGILKKRQPEAAPSAAAAASAAAPVPLPTLATATPAPEPAVADDAIATPQDFEDDAFAKITDKTYKAEIAGLKKEIEAK